MEGPDGEMSWEERQLVADYEEEMAGFESELAEATQLQGGADCATAARLRDNICELAERICAVKENNPDNEEVVAMCDDGRQRCERATNDVAESCGG